MRRQSVPFEDFARAYDEATAREAHVSQQLEAAKEHAGVEGMLDLARRVVLRPSDLIDGWFETMIDGPELYGASFMLHSRAIEEDLPESLESLWIAHDIGSRLCGISTESMQHPQPALVINSAELDYNYTKGKIGVFKAIAGLTSWPQAHEVKDEYRVDRSTGGTVAAPSQVDLVMEDATTVVSQPALDKHEQVRTLYPHRVVHRQKARSWILKSDANQDPNNPVIRTDEKAAFADGFDELMRLREGLAPNFRHVYVGDLAVAAVVNALKKSPRYRGVTRYDYDHGAFDAIIEAAEQALIA